MMPTENVAAAVIAMFAARPAYAVAEIADLAAKHRKSSTTMRSLLSDAVATGVLKREGTEYSRGPQFPLQVPTLGGSSKAIVEVDVSRLSKMPQRANRGPHVRIDPATVVLEDGIPIVDARSAAKREDWSGLLLKMKPGQSFVLPLCKRAQLSKTMSEQHKATTGRWRMSVLAPEKTHFRVWRVEDAAGGEEGRAPGA